MEDRTMVPMSESEAASVVRKFQIVLYSLLLNNVQGIRLRELQALIEKNTGMPFPLEELGIEKFVHFYLDCDLFMDVRSRQKGEYRELYAFIKEDWITQEKIGVRNKIRGRGLPDAVYREDTYPEPISVVLVATPRCVRVQEPDAFSSEMPDLSQAPTNSLSASRNPDPVIRIKRTVLFDKEPYGKNHPFRKRKNEVHKTMDAPVVQEEEKEESFNMNSLKTENHDQAASKRCGPKTLPDFSWPVGDFFVELLGCNQESYLFIRPVNKELQDQYVQLEKDLKEVSPSNTRMVAIERQDFHIGMIVLTYNYCKKSYVRARVDCIDESVTHYPVEYTDLDEADTFLGQFERTFELPEKLRQLHVQAIPIGLPSHLQYLGTSDITNVFTKVSGLHGYLNCKFLYVDEKTNVPVVQLRRPPRGPLVQFKDLIKFRNDSK